MKRALVQVSLASSLLASMWLAAAVVQAGPLRERLAERRAAAAAQDGEMDEDGRPGKSASLPAGVSLVRDVAYGSDRRQRFDVYLPAKAAGAPVLFMVHGGGWRTGDKAMAGVVDNKVARWATQGFIVISTNYRLLPQADVATQLADVRLALSTAQEKAALWGGDGRKFILMGHSAGAHLVSLLASAAPPGTPWLGTVALDSAAFDVETIMQQRHMRLYDQAFGGDPAVWRAASPYAALAGQGAPMLAVCSSRRDDSCAQAQRYAAKAAAMGRKVQVLPQDLSHKQINHELGLAGPYTEAVDAFVRDLLPASSR